MASMKNPPSALRTAALCRLGKVGTYAGISRSMGSAGNSVLPGNGIPNSRAFFKGERWENDDQWIYIYTYIYIYIYIYNFLYIYT